MDGIRWVSSRRRRIGYDPTFSTPSFGFVVRLRFRFWFLVWLGLVTWVVRWRHRKRCLGLALGLDVYDLTRYGVHF